MAYSVNDFKVGDRVRSTTAWGVVPAEGRVVAVEHNHVRINWPDGVKYNDNSPSYMVKPGANFAVGNMVCIRKVETDMLNVAGVELTEKMQASLVEAARKAATNLGYCEETENVLKSMGFKVEPRTEKIEICVVYKGLVDVPVNFDGEVSEALTDEIDSLGSKVTLTFNGETIVLNKDDSYFEYKSS